MVLDLSIALLTGLHGAAATVLICALLVVDEAGVPLFVAPNEVLLMLGGLLIASGGVSAAEFPHSPSWRCWAAPSPGTAGRGPRAPSTCSPSPAAFGAPATTSGPCGAPREPHRSS